MEENKKKMLFITRKYPPSVGGMENGLYNMSINLPDNHLDVHVVALGRNQKNLIWFFPYILFYILVNAKKYDYLFLGDGLICMCGRVAKRVNFKLKRIIILHGLDISYKNPLYQFYLKRNLKKAAEIYACNSHYTENIARKWGLKNGLCTITHGIDINKFTNCKVIDNRTFRDRYNIGDCELIIITVGRLVKRKGVEWFIRNVLPKISNAVYLVIGTGEERANIEKAIKEAEITAKVRLLGRVSEQELKSCYLNTDVFVMPNLHVKDNAEGFGLVALEASLAGLIVVASNVDGIPDAIVNGKNGYLIDSQDSKTFYKIISDIEQNRDRYKVIANQFKEYTIQHYSWSHTCKQIRDAILIQ